MSNFFEKSSNDIGMHYCEKVLERLLELSKSSSSYVCGNAVTCMSSLAESCQQSFAPYYKVLFETYLPIIKEPVPKEFRKFKGQLIEAMCISSV